MSEGIVEKFQEDDWILVNIVLKENSHIAYLENGKSSREVYGERKIANLDRQKDIMKSLSDDEFKLVDQSLIGRWFRGWIKRSALDRLSKNPYVLSIAKPIEGGALLTESVPQIHADDVWEKQIEDTNITGSGETVCVIDSGVDYNHEDISGKVVGKYCFCNVTNYGSGGCCPNNQAEDTNSMDDNGHGTHVAGIIAADGGLNGVAPDVNIVAVKVTNSTINWVDSNLAKGIEWCVDNKDAYNISVISISLGTRPPFLFNDSDFCDNQTVAGPAITEAYINGIFVVAAAGNDANYTAISFPACASKATSVGAVQKNDELWTGYTNVDEILDLVAPGGTKDLTASPPYPEIVSLFSPNVKNNESLCFYLEDGECMDSQREVNNTYYRAEGTSMAAPHVSGAAALLIQYEKLKNNRTMTPAEIETRFKETGKLFYKGYPVFMNFSRIDYNALFPIDVYDFERVSASDTYNVFRFKIRNNYNNKTKAVNWTFDIGNGTIVTSIYDTRLSPGKEVMVFFEENYTDGDIYEVKATGASGTDIDTEEMTLTLGDIITYDLRYVYSNGKHKVFSFKILNNMDSPQLVNWTFYTGASGEAVSADKLTLLEPGKDVLVFFENEYASFGTYTVRAKGFNVNSTDYTKAMTVNAA